MPLVPGPNKIRLRTADREGAQESPASEIELTYPRTAGIRGRMYVVAVGVRDRLGVDVGIAVTGVAGPGGGTDEKPVGLVHFHVSAPDGDEGRSFSLPGDRATIRVRATVASLHLARRVLTRSRHEVV